MAKNREMENTESGEATPTPIKTTVFSIDETNNVILLKTSAPEGETVACKVNGHRHQGQVEDGLVWIRLTRPLGEMYTITPL